MNEKNLCKSVKSVGLKKQSVGLKNINQLKNIH